MKVIQPKRIKHNCVQIWKASPEKVFPLLCPVRETDWVPDWNPKLVVSSSGIMELGCLFVTPEEQNDTIWIVTGYEPNCYVEMYEIIPESTVRKFSIMLDREQENSTKAFISYEYTAISEEGEKIVSNFDEASFTEFANHFEKAINYYLTTGRMIGEIYT